VKVARKPTAIADLDIEGEALTHQDGLAERIARQRGQRIEPPPITLEHNLPRGQGARRAADTVRDANAWRRGKSLLQVAIPEEAHVELSIIAKRRRITLSQVVKLALNDWLKQHGHQLRLPES
jgi:hypothetical protein